MNAYYQMEATVEGVTECFQHDRHTDFHPTAYMGIYGSGEQGSSLHFVEVMMMKIRYVELYGGG